MYGNCIVWAYYMRWQFGGFITTRKSKFGWWRHWMWSPDKTRWFSFVPVHGRRRLIPPPIFLGTIKREP